MQAVEEALIADGGRAGHTLKCAAVISGGVAWAGGCVPAVDCGGGGDGGDVDDVDGCGPVVGSVIVSTA